MSHNCILGRQYSLFLDLRRQGHAESSKSFLLTLWIFTLEAFSPTILDSSCSIRPKLHPRLLQGSLSHAAVAMSTSLSAAVLFRQLVPPKPVLGGEEPLCPTQPKLHPPSHGHGFSAPAIILASKHQQQQSPATPGQRISICC